MLLGIMSVACPDDEEPTAEPVLRETPPGLPDGTVIDASRGPEVCASGIAVARAPRALDPAAFVCTGMAEEGRLLPGTNIVERRLRVARAAMRESAAPATCPVGTRRVFRVTDALVPQLPAGERLLRHPDLNDDEELVAAALARRALCDPRRYAAEAFADPGHQIHRCIREHLDYHQAEIDPYLSYSKDAVAMFTPTDGRDSSLPQSAAEGRYMMVACLQEEGALDVNELLGTGHKFSAQLEVDYHPSDAEVNRAEPDATKVGVPPFATYLMPRKQSCEPPTRQVVLRAAAGETKLAGDRLAAGARVVAAVSSSSAASPLPFLELRHHRPDQPGKLVPGGRAEAFRILDVEVREEGAYELVLVVPGPLAGPPMLRVGAYLLDGGSACGTASHCFGAWGTGCDVKDALVKGGACRPTKDARVECTVSPGTQSEDTCRAQTPGASCKPEADHAIFDVEVSSRLNSPPGGRSWTAIFDPTEILFGPQSLTSPSFGIQHQEVIPDAARAFLAPPGQGLWLADAKNGWCEKKQYRTVAIPDVAICGCPESCEQMRASCGRPDNGCGKKLDCGVCGAGSVCREDVFRCESVEVCARPPCNPPACDSPPCGPATPPPLEVPAPPPPPTRQPTPAPGPYGEACVARTCAAMGQRCGWLDDLCGKVLNCGATGDPGLCTETQHFDGCVCKECPRGAIRNPTGVTACACNYAWGNVIQKENGKALNACVCDPARHYRPGVGTAASPCQCEAGWERSPSGECRRPCPINTKRDPRTSQCLCQDGKLPFRIDGDKIVSGRPTAVCRKCIVHEYTTDGRAGEPPNQLFVNACGRTGSWGPSPNPNDMGSYTHVNGAPASYWCAGANCFGVSTNRPGSVSALDHAEWRAYKSSTVRTRGNGDSCGDGCY